MDGMKVALIVLLAILFVLDMSLAFLLAAAIKKKGELAPPCDDGQHRECDGRQ